jgi:WD40 repeat protein
MAFSPDSQRLATLTSDPLSLALWDLQTGQKTVCPRQTDKGMVDSPCFSPDGKLAAITGNGTRTICTWNGTTGAKIGAWSDNPVSGGRLSARRDGFLLASAQPDQPIKGFLEKPARGIQLIDPTNGAKLRMVGPESFWLPFPVLSPNGERLAAVSKEGVLHLWDTANGQLLLTTPSRDWVRFTNDGRYLIRETTQKSMEIWDANTGKPADLHLPPRPFYGPVQFAPDGKLIAWPIEKGEILLWNGATGKPSATLRGHGSPLASSVFSNDGKRLFTVGAEDGTVKIWDTATGLEICSLHHAKGTQGQLLLSPDGRKLALRNTGGTFVWDATPVPAEATGSKPGGS